MKIYDIILEKKPGLRQKLRAIHYKDSREYVKKSFITALYSSLMIGLIFFMLSKKPLWILSSIIVFPLLLEYFLRRVDVKLARISKEIDKEVVFATRFLIIELDSGINLFEAMKGVAENYEAVGKYFREITEKIEMGTSMEDAIRETIEELPNENLQRVLWQILNSMSTGGNISQSLKTIIDQIVRENQIKVKEYGRKLNPIAMFYMTSTIILPSIGTILLAVMAMFIGIKLTLGVLLILAFLIVLLQLSFLMVIRNTRPPVDI